MAGGASSGQVFGPLPVLALGEEPAGDLVVRGGCDPRTHLEALQADPVVARAMQIEMDAAGRSARRRRRLALRQIADVIASRHALLPDEDPSIGPLQPPREHLAVTHAYRSCS